MFLQGSGSPPGLDLRMATVVVRTLLTDLRYNAWRRHLVLSRDQVLRCQFLLLLRGLLGAHLHTDHKVNTDTPASGASDDNITNRNRRSDHSRRHRQPL